MAHDLVTVASYQFPHEAEIARMRLESRDVRADLADTETVNTDWFLGNALGYIKLQVSRTQAESARAVLQEIENRQAVRNADAGIAAEGTACLDCGAPLPDGQTICPVCGWSYADEEAEEQADGRADASASVMERFPSL